MLGKRCPECGHDKFMVTAHVTQDWVVDGCGNFVRSLNDCVEVTHHPNDEDIWDCEKCFHSGSGKDFIRTSS